MTDQGKKNLMNYIYAVSFAVDEAKLFLDTHPDQPEALKYFENYNQARNKALMEYGMHYGPLTVSQAMGGKEFLWATQPWPWEREGC